MQKKNPKKSAKKAQKPAKKKKAKPPKEKKLTPRDKLFAIEYLADLNLNPERAAKKVGYSDTVARTKAYQWVSDSKHKPLLFKRIKDLIDKPVTFRWVASAGLSRLVSRPPSGK